MAAVSDSDSKDEITFQPNPPVIVQPYMFEPRVNDRGEHWEVPAVGQEDRTDNTNWCSCSQCKAMPTAVECYCCQELEPVKQKLEELDSPVSCISQHPGFEPIGDQPCCPEAPPEEAPQPVLPVPTKAWYRDEEEEDVYSPHLTDPPRYLSDDELFEETGVRILKVDDCDDGEKQEDLRKQGGYNYFDWLEVTPEVLKDEYETKIEHFYTEHLHKDEEVRLVTAGSGFFEVRDHHDNWIRLHIEKGDLLKLPAGIYHRFTLDSDKYIKMLRLYTSSPKWEAVNRPEGDCIEARVEYLKAIPETSV